MSTIIYHPRYENITTGSVLDSYINTATYRWDNNDRGEITKSDKSDVTYGGTFVATNYLDTTVLEREKYITYGDKSNLYSTGWEETGSVLGEWKVFHSEPPTPEERIKQIIRDRQAPMILTPRDSIRRPLQVASDGREGRARETLHRVLGDAKFRAFLRNGFITVRAKSGLVYQILPGHGITSVYDQGKMVERLCVVLEGNFPPTDSLIMRYLLILNDEKDFRQKSNVFPVVSKNQGRPLPDQRSLPDIFAELKAA